MPSSSAPPLRAAIEAGGTKFVCAIGTGPHDVRASTVIPTTSPAETLGRVAEFFAGYHAVDARIESVGVASFGPLDLRPQSPTYGFITTTPKPGWAGTDLVGVLQRELGVPIVLETDVNGAAYGEYRWGANRGLWSSAYITVGTGVGGGAVIDGRTVRGLVHPEMGHLHVRRHPFDTFAGSCPFHLDCLEGLASGPAIRDRFGRAAQELDGDVGFAVELEAWYLAQLVSAVTYLLSPERIVLGGGVLGLPGLLDAVRAATVERLAGALDLLSRPGQMQDYLVPPGLGERSGVLGALALAEALPGQPQTQTQERGTSRVAWAGPGRRTPLNPSAPTVGTYRPDLPTRAKETHPCAP